MKTILVSRTGWMSAAVKKRKVTWFAHVWLDLFGSSNLEAAFDTIVFWNFYLFIIHFIGMHPKIPIK